MRGKNEMELLGYSMVDWFIIISCSALVVFWLAGEDWDG